MQIDSLAHQETTATLVITTTLAHAAKAPVPIDESCMTLACRARRHGHMRAKQPPSVPSHVREQMSPKGS